MPTAYRRGPSSRLVRVGLVLDKMTAARVFFSEYIVSCQLSAHRFSGLNFLSSEGRTVGSLEAEFRKDYFISSQMKSRRWHDRCVFKYIREAHSSACDLHLRIMGSDLVFFSFHLWFCECGKAACSCENGNVLSTSIK